MQIVLFQTIQYRMSTQFVNNISISSYSVNSNKSVQYKYAVSMSKQFYFKQFSLA